MTPKVTTNNVPRPVLDSYELTPAERLEFDYLDWTALEAGEDSASFFRYRGNVYDLGDCQRLEHGPEDSPLRKWDGFYSESFFSAVVVKVVALDGDSYGSGVIVGHYYE